MSELLSIVVFSTVMSITPGPVNIIIISSSITVGFKKTFSFVSGATAGFTLLLILCALGLDSFINDLILNYLSFFSAIFLIYLGIKIFKYTDISFKKNNKVTTF